MEYALLSIVAVALVALAIALFREKLLEKSAARVSSEDISKISAELEDIGSAESTSFFICKLTDAPSQKFQIKLPETMEVSWLKGKLLSVHFNAAPCDDADAGEVSIARMDFSPDFRLAPIPRNILRSGKEVNQYQPKAWFKKNKELQRLASKLNSRQPEQFLSLVLDGMGRVNAPFEWLQTPPRTRCTSCKKKTIAGLPTLGRRNQFGQRKELLCSCM